MARWTGQVLSGVQVMSTISQVGGTHYSQTSYQHWDWANDLQLSYPIAAATKYLYRWNAKGTPKQDLEKAISYIQFQYLNWKGPASKEMTEEGFIKMVRKLAWPCPDTTQAVEAILLRKYILAEALIRGILDGETQKR